jgi:DNA-binding NarL/FixJ family response regulator
MNEGRIRIVVADDQALVRAGFRMILDAQEDLEGVGEAADGEEAVAAWRRLRPDVVLMDIRMPRLDGLEATRRIMEGDGSSGPGEAGPWVIMLTTFDLDEYVCEALRAGASGFLLKDVSRERLVAAVRDVAAGDMLLAPAITRRLIERFARRRPATAATAPSGYPALSTLTEREVEVLALIARGLSNTEIASELVVAESTVKTHVARIFDKLELRDRAQAVIVAYESGIVQISD